MCEQNFSGDMPPLYLFIPQAESNQVCPGSFDFRVGFPWSKESIANPAWVKGTTSIPE